MINQSPKYPKTGPKMDQGEQLKFKKYYDEYKTFKLDISYTTSILQSIAEDNPIDSIAWNKKNFERLMGFSANNSYQKIPRDALRVTMLSLCTKINKELALGTENP